MCCSQTNNMKVTLKFCRAIAQGLVAGSPPRRPGFDPRVKSCGVCGGQSGTGADFRRVFRFPLPILIPPNAPSIIRGWYNAYICLKNTLHCQSQLPLRVSITVSEKFHYRKHHFLKSSNRYIGCM
jgi:hypothetical protein